MEMIIRTKSKNLDDTAISAIKNILDMNKEEARKFVWNAWCDPTSISSAMGLTLPESQIQVWVNELRYQFETLYPEKTLGSEEAFLKLAKVTNNFVANEIRGKIVEYSYRDLEAIQRVGYLLNSDVSKYYYGGFRELGFSKIEAEKLKSIHCQVSALFEEFILGKYPDFKAEKHISTTPSASKVSSADKKHESSEINQKAVDSLTAESVLSNMSLIEEYYKIVEQLNKAGITPDLLEKKKTAVVGLLSSSKLLG